jgi:hypothetical protein
MESIMTVCSYCKRVRDKNEWVSMEQLGFSTKELGLRSHWLCAQWGAIWV